MPSLPNRRGARAILWLERLLLTAGTIALVVCALVVGDAMVAQRSARRTLDLASSADRPGWPPAPAPVTARLPADVAPAAGAPVAALAIPRVDLSAVVLHGSDARTLRRGPGHLEHTPLPGEPGNVVIAGHRDSFFWPLRLIRLGDDIFLETTEARFHYRVTAVGVVKPNDVSVLAGTDEATLTLITCYPFLAAGPAPDRFVVRATLEP